MFAMRAGGNALQSCHGELRHVGIAPGAFAALRKYLHVACQHAMPSRDLALRD